ncbi:SNF2 family amino-terminal protein, partial [Trifolium medium]|nr:SNF2 family amino-terminal protein [Trifolium medium]
IPKNAEVISIDDEDEEGFKKEVKIDEIGDKDGNFVDENCGWDSENPITICSDEEHVGSDEEEDGVKVGVKSDESGGI